MRFLSHRDMIRLFERAVSRANLPIHYSEGFNPRLRLRLPLPRSVGVASDDELLVIELDRHETPDRVVQQLTGELPDGVVLGQGLELAGSTTPRPVEVTYQLDLAGETSTALAEAARRIMRADRLIVQRRPKKHGPPRTVDVRAWIVRIEISHHLLTATLRVSPEGSARPAEVIALLDLDPTETLSRFRRVAVQWEGLEIQDARASSPGINTTGRT
jgi:radical SAM-linked protein